MWPRDKPMKKSLGCGVIWLNARSEVHGEALAWATIAAIDARAAGDLFSNVTFRVRGGCRSIFATCVHP